MSCKKEATTAFERLSLLTQVDSRTALGLSEGATWMPVLGQVNPWCLLLTCIHLLNPELFSSVLQILLNHFQLFSAWIVTAKQSRLPPSSLRNNARPNSAQNLLIVLFACPFVGKVAC